MRAALDANGGAGLVRHPDLSDETGNAARRRALSEARGWGTGTRLFAGFPPDVTWVHGALDRDELARIRYIRYSYWVALSGGSRRPADVRVTIESGHLPQWLVDMGTDVWFEQAEVLRRRGTTGDLLVAGTPDLRELVLVEGHARLTALYVGGLEDEVEITAYVGTTPSIGRWSLF